MIFYLNIVQSTYEEIFFKIKDLSQAICCFLKVETTLRRAMQPNVNDVTLKWGSDIKAIHIPSELPPIFMGERMITYAVIKTDKKVQ